MDMMDSRIAGMWGEWSCSAMRMRGTAGSKIKEPVIHMGSTGFAESLGKYIRREATERKQAFT